MRHRSAPQAAAAAVVEVADPVVVVVHAAVVEAVAVTAVNEAARMATLSLVDAFAKFGAKPTTRLRGLSAIASDGALVLKCALPRFGRPQRGVLRYEDQVSRESTDPQGSALLKQHISRAHDEGLPVRMVVASAADASNGKISFHVRPDLVGKVTAFDGDKFTVDFTRSTDPLDPVAARGR
jgi:hypothetical protein